MKSNNETHKIDKKSIFKHGVIGITAIAITVILIIFGIYFYHITHKSVADERSLKPVNVNTNQTTLN